MTAAVLTGAALNGALLARQGLLEPISLAADAAVSRLGSLQAQHPEWPPVALAARAANRRAADLASALERRTVVRSSLMRMTIHVVSADDLWPMFTACQPLRLQNWRALLKADPVDSELGRRMAASHATALAALAERPRSSHELDRLMSAEIGPLRGVAPRAAWRHLAAFVPLVHVPHEHEGYGRSLYAVAETWLGVRPAEIDIGAARAHLARRYLAAFGPAGVDDLASYVGRGPGGIGVWRSALAVLGDEVIAFRDEGGRSLYDLHDAPRPEVAAPPARLLARWDSMLLSHTPAQRRRVISDQHRAAVYTRNADVLPTFLVDGMVAGTWELSRDARHPRITLSPFGPIDRSRRGALLAEAKRILELLLPDAHDRSAVMSG